MTKHLWRKGQALLCATAMAVAACGDGTGPGGPFDPVATSDATDDVMAALAASQAVQSIDVMAASFPSFGGAPAAMLRATLPVAAPAAEDDAAWIGARLARASEAASYLSPAAPAAIFPADVLGKTFVWNPSTGQFDEDPALSGAPEFGIRIMLVAVDPILRQPVEPIVEIGHLDLEDKSNPAADALSITAVVSGNTVLDYDASAVRTTTSVTFSAVGFLAHDGKTVDFDLEQSFSETELSVDYLVSLRDGNASIHLQITINPQTQSASYTLTINHDGNEVILSVSGDDTAFSGTVTHNGETVIEISGSGDTPTFTDPDGNPISPEHLAALGRLFERVGEIINNFEKLLEPAHRVLQVSGFDF